MDYTSLARLLGLSGQQANDASDFLKYEAQQSYRPPIMGFGGGVDEQNRSGEIIPGLLALRNILGSRGGMQDKPDFFSGQPSQPLAAYVQPRQIDMNAPRPMNALRNDYFANDRMRPGVESYLSQLLSQKSPRYSGGY